MIFIDTGALPTHFLTINQNKRRTAVLLPNELKEAAPTLYAKTSQAA